MDAIIERLDELIAATKEAGIPIKDRWLDCAGIGVLMGFKPRYVLEHITCRPDFPAPFRLDGTGHPRWPAAEVLEWIQKNRTSGRGREPA